MVLSGIRAFACTSYGNFNYTSIYMDKEKTSSYVD